VAIVGMPTSCEDLWRIGHSLSGLYLVLEGEIVKNVYCDFTKLSNEAGDVHTKTTNKSKWLDDKLVKFPQVSRI
jgi:hypothetical protein